MSRNVAVAGLLSVGLAALALANVVVLDAIGAAVVALFQAAS